MPSKGVKVGGITIEIGGDSTELTNALQAVQRDLTRTGSVLKEVTSELSKNPKNVSGIKDQIILLNNESEQAKNKLELLNQTYERMSQQDTFNAMSTEAVALRTEIQKTKDQIAGIDQKLEAMKTKPSYFEQLKKTAIESYQEVQNVGKELEKIASKVESVGKHLSVVSAAVTAVGTKSVNEFASFEKEISRVAAAMGTTVDQIPEIEDKARELGRTTVFTAEEAAQGFVILAQAGYDAEKQIEVLPNVLNLAAAGGLSLDEAARYLTGTLNGFSKSVKVSEDENGDLITTVIKSTDRFIDAGEATEKYADLLAKGATLAKTNVGELGEAMSVTASIASGAYKQSAESVTVALLRLADQNVTGATAGTALNRVMQDLYAPTDKAAEAMRVAYLDLSTMTVRSDEAQKALLSLGLTGNQSKKFLEEFAKSNKDAYAYVEELGISEEKATEVMRAFGISAYDANGDAREINEVIDQLAEYFDGMSDNEKAAAENLIFTTRGMKAFNQLAATSSTKAKQFSSSLSNIGGSAGQQASTMLDNFNGRMTLLKSAASDAMIEIGDALVPTIEVFTNKIREVIDWFSSLDDESKQNIVNIGLMVAAAGPLVLVIGKISSAIGALLAHPVLALVAAATAGIVALAVAVDEAAKASNTHLIALQAEMAEYEEMANLNQSSLDAYKDKVQYSQESSKQIIAEANAYQTLVEKLKSCVDENGNVKEGEEKQVAYILGELNNAYGLHLEVVDGQISEYQDLISTIDDLIAKRKAEALSQRFADTYAESLSNQMDILSRMNEAQNAYNTAIAKQAEIQDLITAKRADVEELGQYIAYFYSGGKQGSADPQKRTISELNTLYEASKTELNQLNAALNYVNEQYANAETALSAVTEEYALNQRTIANYDALTEAIVNGSMQEIEDATLKMAYDLKTADNSTKQMLVQQATAYSQMYAAMVKASKDGTAQISQSTLDEMARIVEMSKQELIKINTYDVGAQIVRGLAQGIKDNSYLATNAAGNVTNATLAKMKNTAVIKSPSHVTQWFGEMIDRGLEKGITDYSFLPEDAAEEVTSGTLDAFKGNALLSQNVGQSGSVSNNATTNVGGMVFNIYAQPGQDVQELARLVSNEVARNINSQKAVFA